MSHFEYSLHCKLEQGISKFQISWLNFFTAKSYLINVRYASKYLKGAIATEACHAAIFDVVNQQRKVTCDNVVANRYKESAAIQIAKERCTM